MNPPSYGTRLASIVVALFLGAAWLASGATPVPPDPEAVATAPEPPKPALPESVRVPILTYHNIRVSPKWENAFDRVFDVSPATFERQLDWLVAEGFEPVTFARLHAALAEGEPLPKKPVIISFDDGRATQYDAYLSLKRRGLVGTFYVFTNALGRKGYLSWEQLASMRDDGMEIGDHTRYHPYLTRLRDPEELEAEVSGSRKTLEERLGIEVTTFAYPFGLFDATVTAEVAKAGYLTARTIRNGNVQTLSGRLTLGSFQPTEDFEAFKRLMNE